MPGPDAPLPDALSGHWVDTRAPRSFRPFLKLARIERPIGWWLILLPCWWGAGLAAIAAGRPYPDPWHCLLFLIGAVLMRGAGCTFNDIIDRKLDAAVARTRGRPLPSGQVTKGRPGEILDSHRGHRALHEVVVRRGQPTQQTKVGVARHPHDIDGLERQDEPGAARLGEIRHPGGRGTGCTTQHAE